VSAGRRAVFLDRDGVLVATAVHGGKPIAALTLTDFTILPEAPAAVAALKAAGFVTVVVTNQPEMARGNVDSATMDAMHARLGAAMPIDAVYVCPHDSGDGCGCRKPAPGMLLRAADELGLDLASSYMIGDRWRDVGAGRAAGCTTVLIECGYDEPERLEPDLSAGDVAEAAARILDRERAARAPGERA